MAPEVIKEELITLKCDVYSYGIVLWELLTREIPFSDMPLVQVVWAVAECDERPEIPSTFPAGFHTIIEQCWQQEPEQRPSWRDIITHVQTCDLDLQTQVKKSNSNNNRDSDDINIVEPSLSLAATTSTRRSEHASAGAGAAVSTGGGGGGGGGGGAGGGVGTAAGGILSAGSDDTDALLLSQGSWNHEIKRGLDTLRERYHRRIGIATQRFPPPVCAEDVDSAAPAGAGAGAV